MPAPSATPELTFTRATTLLDTIPGGNQRGAERLIAEWGIDMARFGSAGRLAAWSGVALGNDESAGKQRAGTTRKRNRVLRAGLTPLAHAAVRTKGHVSVGLLSSDCRSPWEETCDYGRGPLYRRKRVFHAHAQRTVSRIGGDLLGQEATRAYRRPTCPAA
jgi:hypothetical protein